MDDTVGPAAYVLFDELYTKEKVFRSIITSNKTLNIRLLGRFSAFKADSNLVELLSPFQGGAIPCVIVNVKYLTENQKQCFSSQTANERLIQFIGELSISDDKKHYHLTAFSFTFMDGVSLDLYRTVTKITRSYIAYLPSL
ncbi:unnamed protein product [Schistosoma bovis]|uniref:Mitochondrial import inner membrane translocase subunit Tim17-A n=1 Tax=Schistosoma haematobium TaxID=6185 RepID=A0A095CBJ6_SCHHA|nr:Mitochondrial import inner membrane translocase subunit Tim17-A [Schistosoma haematobium]CAH8565011.1 unnamed protein product [Schistosoma intercalatum]CAH8578397.1 unnamed protein product [Schistosoma bovis]KAH9582841.1 Mitochondrial import inner membrane translocase subunit Tim17-A [Schistosoma haematobium]CAH8566244.1 unnamed protein product [Schistosoma intercalatum]CAH8583765.1 unnamed protein product [Schistosoma bovis]